MCGDVEADHRHVDAAREDAVRGFRVRPDVELGGGRDVALGDRAAHEDYAGDALLDPGVAREEKADVGQRPYRNEDDAVVLLDGLRDEVDRMSFGGLLRRSRQIRSVEPALAVHVRGGPLLADERAVAADVDRDVRAVDELEDLERVRRRLLERLIPRDGGDAEHLDLR